MTQEQKAKAYDEIIKKANKMHNENCEVCKACLEELIPELAESEDERVRKALITYFSDEDESYDGIPYPSILAWLEKQSKASKVEQAMREVEEKAEAFTEAHKGETSEEILAQMRGEQKPWNEEDERIIDGLISICDEAQDNIPRLSVRFSHVEALKNWLTSLKDRVQPKQEWSEKDKHIWDIVWDMIDGKFAVSDSAEKEAKDWFISLKDRFVPQSRQEWKQENTHDLTDFENVMMHIGDSFFGQYAGLDPNDTIAIKEQATILLGLVPKQEWSDEDEDNFKHLLDEIVCLGNNRNSANRLYYDRLIKFIKELKNRAQPKEKWCDKDERMLDRLIAYFEKQVAFTDDDNPRYANWLKSLRPQNRWKPSEEQMMYLSEAIDVVTRAEKFSIATALKELREQLKKLREE